MRAENLQLRDQLHAALRIQDSLEVTLAKQRGEMHLYAHVTEAVRQQEFQASAMHAQAVYTASRIRNQALQVAYHRASARFDSMRRRLKEIAKCCSLSSKASYYAHKRAGQTLQELGAEIENLQRMAEGYAGPL